MTPKKPLGRKAYGSIGHLPQSRMGPGDHHVTEGQARICTVKPRDRHDVIIVQEKLDGSCVSVARVDGEILALGRSGYLAQSSRYEQHQLFAAWVREREALFAGLLQDGERIVGEWLAQAHATRYDLAGREPFVAFDLMCEDRRLPYAEFTVRVAALAQPTTVAAGNVAVGVESALEHLGEFGKHGALDPIEGIVYRVERNGLVDFLAKFVRPNKVDGSFLPEVSGQPAVWNWRPGG